MQYDSEKKEQQIALLNKDNALQQTEIQKQKAQRNAVMCGFALVLLLVVVIFNRYYVTKSQQTNRTNTYTFKKHTGAISATRQANSTR